MSKLSVVENLRKAKSYIKKGNVEKARALYEAILEKFPNNKNAKFGLNSLVQKEFFSSAHRATEFLNLLYAKGQYEAVISEGNSLLKTFSNNEKIWNVLGASYLAQGNQFEALSAFRNVVRCNPKNADGHNNLGVVQKDFGLLFDAQRSLELAISLDPQHPDAYFNLGLVYHMEWKLLLAVKNYEKAIEINPLRTSAYYSLAHAFQYSGRIEDALHSYNKVLELDPSHCDAIRNMSDLIKVDENHQLIVKTENLLRIDSLASSSKAALYFAYGKMNEDLENFDTAFTSFEKGGHLRRAELGYEINHDLILFSLIKKYFSGEVETLGEPTLQNGLMQPIFIVGMPRSGTSLIEQVICSHSRVVGCGELNKLDELCRPLLDSSAKNLESEILQLRANYLKYVEQRVGTVTAFTDKMPSNFRFIGFIVRAFPEAKIVHTKRDPGAVCWSNFRHYFNGSALPYSYDINDVVDYYNLYAELMSFWKNLYGNRIYDLDYEKLVSDPTCEIKSLISHLKLGWEEACLSPHKNKRSVGTASSLQVKEKIYSGSSKFWHKYKPYVKGAFDRLGST